MSIVDSGADLAAAKARLAAADDTALLEDLRFWSVAEIDASEDYNALAERQVATRHRYQEAASWTGLIATELRSRRGGRPVEPEQ